MHLDASNITALVAVLGAVVMMGRLTFRVGALVEKVETLIVQKGADHIALNDRINTVAGAVDRHEQWHIDHQGRGRHYR